MVGDLSSDESVSMRTNNLAQETESYSDEFDRTLDSEGYFEGIYERWKNEDLSHVIEIFILRDEYLCDKYDAMMRCLSS